MVVFSSVKKKLKRNRQREKGNRQQGNLQKGKKQYLRPPEGILPWKRKQKGAASQPAICKKTYVQTGQQGAYFDC